MIWAEGPSVDGFVVNFSLSIVPGPFDLNDDPGQVAETLGTLGVGTTNAEVRSIDGRDFLFATTGDNPVAATYVVPDSGYASQFTFTAPAGGGHGELADQIAYTIQGC